ncbi:MAG: hypothetical protein PHQ89_03275 [Bacilli bacterium]|nr:hypothetical protein [Bacilli bacterium]
MKILVRNKGLLIFYTSLLMFTFLCSWRLERLENKNVKTENENNAIVLNVK